MTPHVLSREQARRIIVRAELLDAQRPGDVVEVAEQLLQIKIDPTAVIAPSEQTIPWSRIGWPYEPGQLKKAVEDDRVLFEYDGAFRPASLLPALLTKMRHAELRTSTQQWLEANARFRGDVLTRLGAEGPLFSADIADTSQVSRAPNGWSGSNQVPIMLEILAYLGEVAVVGRHGRQRCWDLAERVYSVESSPLTLEDATAEIEQRSLQAAGLARPHRYWSGAGKETGEPATVEGSGVRFRVDPEALAALDDPDPGGRVALLNPYDRMLFDRTRLAEVFEFTFVLEQFKPKPQRVFGYFAHPILCGDRFIGMLDAEVDRPRETLRVNAIHELTPWDADERELVRAEIRELSDWLGVAVSGLE